MNKKNQNHYERIYLEDENGNITFYGYKKENETIELKRTYSEKQNTIIFSFTVSNTC